MSKPMLFSPGPIMVKDNVREAMMHYDICHRGAEFEELFAATKLSELISRKEDEKECKKVLWALAIVGAIAAVAAAIYVVLQKVKAKNAPESYDEDNYVSCSCLEDDFISETVAE